MEICSRIHRPAFQAVCAESWQRWTRTWRRREEEDEEGEVRGSRTFHALAARKRIRGSRMWGCPLSPLRA